jgi:hypothetical protein
MCMKKERCHDGHTIFTFPSKSLQGCIQKFLDCLPCMRTASGTALCQYVQLYHYFVSQSSEFYHHNPLCCFWMSSTKDKCIFRYWLSPETWIHPCISCLSDVCFKLLITWIWSLWSIRTAGLFEKVCVISCNIWGFHGDKDSSCLLGCDTM